MSSTLSFLVLMSIIGRVLLISVKTSQKVANVTVGGSASLHCSFTTSAPTNRLTIQWDFVALHSNLIPKQVYYYQGGLDVIAAAYKDRLQPPSQPNTTKDASIVIHNMQTSDSGVYTCTIHNLPDIEGNSEASIIVNVFERPSVPYCSVFGDLESGHMVTLTCHSEHGSPPPKYSWVRLDQKKARMTVGGTVTTTGIMHIGNISQFEFGEYQCNASNVVGSNICTVELSPELTDGIIAGAVIGALLGCLLIGLVVWFIAHRVKKHRYKEVKVPASEMKAMPQNATRGSAYQDAVTSEGIPMATAPSHLHAEGEEAEA